VNTRDILAWAILLSALAWMAHDRKAAHPLDDCQAVDMIGNGIGCEEPDIADR
jgi:hypothetical protein